MESLVLVPYPLAANLEDYLLPLVFGAGVEFPTRQVTSVYDCRRDTAPSEMSTSQAREQP